MSKSAKPRTATVAVSDTVATEHPAATDEKSLNELDKVAKRLAKKKGGRDASE